MMRKAVLIACLVALGGSVWTGCGGGAPSAPPDAGPAASPDAAVPGPATGDPAARPAPEPGDEYPRPPRPARQYTIGVVLPHLSNPHFVGQAYGYIDEGRALGARVTLLEAGGYQYLDRQISQVEDLIASRVDAIVLVAVSGPGTVGVIDRAVAAGIPVINCNVMTDSDNVVIRIRSDDEAIGEMQAAFMGQALNGAGSVVMLRGAPGTSWAEVRGNSFRRRLAESYPDVKIVGEQYSQSTPADGLRLMEDFLQTYPRIDGVYNGADATAIGAAQAVLASGGQGRTIITTTDFQSDTERFMREGVITASVVQQTVIIGRWGIRAAINHLERRPTPETLWTPLLVVTRETMDSIDMRGVRSPDGWTPPVGHGG